MSILERSKERFGKKSEGFGKRYEGFRRGMRDLEEARGVVFQIPSDMRDLEGGEEL